MKRGKVRWYKFQHPDKKKHVLILTRDSVHESVVYLTAELPQYFFAMFLVGNGQDDHFPAKDTVIGPEIAATHAIKGRFESRQLFYSGFTQRMRG